MEIKCPSRASVSMYAFSGWCLKHSIFHSINGSYEILNNNDKNDKIEGDPWTILSLMQLEKVTIDTEKLL